MFKEIQDMTKEDYNSELLKLSADPVYIYILLLYN